MSKNRILNLIIIILLVTSFVLTYLLISSKKNCNANNNKYPEIYDHLNSLTINNFKEMVDNKDFIVYIGRPSCSDCNMFDEKFIPIINDKKYENKLFYLNVSSIHNNKKEWEDFKQKFGISGTPSFVYYSKGQIIDKIEWTAEHGINLEEVINWLEKTGN